MKQKIIIITSFLIILGLVGGCFYFFSKKENDQQRFQSEYEGLNDTHVSIQIPDNNLIKYASFDEIIDLLDHKTGVIYFGFPECPWCRNAIPVLIDTAQKNNINTIYYFNAKDLRDQKSLNEEGNIIIENEGTEEYKQLILKLYDFLPVYGGLNDPSLKRLYFPTMVFVKDGVILGSHMGTVDSQVDAKNPLTSDQKTELETIYQSYFDKMKQDGCTNAC